jgi:hypothetical protein
MNLKSKSAISRAAFALGGCILSASILFAGAGRTQVKLAPLVVETQAGNGQAQGSLEVTNTTNEVFRARVYAEPFTYDRDKGFQSIPTNPNDLTPYLQFSPRELTVPPGTTRRVRLITRIPPNAPDGEYRAVVFTENLVEIKDSTGSNVTLKARVGSTIYVRKGNVSAPSFTVDNASLNGAQKQLQLLVRNTGQSSGRPGVNWTLKQGDKVIKTGKAEATGVIAQTDRNILLNFPGTNGAALSPGTYQLAGELVWGEENNKRTSPFSVNLTIPAQAANSK